MHYPSDHKRCINFVLYFVGKQLKQKVSGKDWEMPEETGENSLFFHVFYIRIITVIRAINSFGFAMKNNKIAEIALNIRTRFIKHLLLFF